nr:phosphomevalonate kinase [Helcococcus sueciensis]
MIEVKVPGKLYIAGEYSVVMPGHKSVAIAIDKFITVKLKESTHSGTIKSYSNIKLIWSRRDNEIVVEQRDDRFEYIIQAMHICDEFISAKGITPKYYDIEVLSELESEDGLKYGLGSSASVVVAVTKAILQFYKYEYTNMEIFKLATLASMKLIMNSSFGDIATVCFTGIVKYRSFDREFIKKFYDFNGVLKTIELKWNTLSIEKIKRNKEYKILVGWTKSPASSDNLVRKSINRIKNNDDFINRFTSESDKCVDDFIDAYASLDFEYLKEAIEENRMLLLEYSKRYGIEIEKDSLHNLIEISKNLDLASKTSGAGGGDCGIAISKHDFDTKILEENWNSKGIKMLDLDVYEEE